ncbi:MAG: hypothetical protein AAGD00_04700 [Planctomycetota bacterium]
MNRHRAAIISTLVACLGGCAAPQDPTPHRRATPTFDASVHGASGLDFVGPSLDHANATRAERRQLRTDRAERRRAVRRSDPVLTEPR